MTRIEKEVGAAREGAAVLGIDIVVGGIAPSFVGVRVFYASINIEVGHFVERLVQDIELRELQRAPASPLHARDDEVEVAVLRGVGIDVSVAPVVLIDHACILAEHGPGVVFATIVEVLAPLVATGIVVELVAEVAVIDLVGSHAVSLRGGVVPTVFDDGALVGKGEFLAFDGTDDGSCVVAVRHVELSGRGADKGSRIAWG